MALDAAVLHAGVAHRGRPCLVVADRAVDQLADEYHAAAKALDAKRY